MFNMKKKLTVIFASLFFCFVSVSCTVNYQPIYTVYTDTLDYYDFAYYFRSEISDGCYKRLELSYSEWYDVCDFFEEGEKHFYSDNQITNWFLAHDFGEDEAFKETAWLTIVDHGFIAAREGDIVYLISK